MIKIGDIEMEFVYMGLFTTTDPWMHPIVTEKTYEIIYVTAGEVHLFEGEQEYHLRENDTIVLSPGMCHGGCAESHGRTSFYWLHFTLRGENPFFPTTMIRGFGDPALLRELLHYSNMPGASFYRIEATLAYLLAELSAGGERANASSLAASVLEWSRINARCGLTVEAVATHFGYNKEHISRLVRTQYGTGLKALIDDFILKKAGDLLCNTTYSVKEIAALLHFPSSGALIHFFQYHKKQSPTQYRNRFPYTHMNKH